jgi:hypothetical protein
MYISRLSDLLLYGRSEHVTKSSFFYKIAMEISDIFNRLSFSIQFSISFTLVDIFIHLFLCTAKLCTLNGLLFSVLLYLELNVC